MTPIEVAITVKEAVKQRIPILGRSDNKMIQRELMSNMTPDKEMQVTLDRMKVTAGVHNVRTHPRCRLAEPSKARPKDILAYGSIVMAAGEVGNSMVSEPSRRSRKNAERDRGFGHRYRGVGQSDDRVLRGFSSGKRECFASSAPVSASASRGQLRQAVLGVFR